MVTIEEIIPEPKFRPDHDQDYRDMKIRQRNRIIQAIKERETELLKHQREACANRWERAIEKEANPQHMKAIIRTAKI